jgi:hypothetical protein
MLYVGVDLHRKASQVAVVDEQGKLIFNRHVPSQREDLLRVFGEAGPIESMQVAYEATYAWGWFADLLEDVRIPAHMAHPRANKAIASARVKNDAVDAKTLARLLRTGLLPESGTDPDHRRAHADQPPRLPGLGRGNPRDEAEVGLGALLGHSGQLLGHPSQVAGKKVPKAAGLFRLAPDDCSHRPVGAHPLEFMASGDGRFLIGSLDRMLTMDVNRIDE